MKGHGAEKSGKHKGLSSQELEIQRKLLKTIMPDYEICTSATLLNESAQTDLTKDDVESHISEFSHWSPEKELNDMSPSYSCVSEARSEVFKYDDAYLIPDFIGIKFSERPRILLKNARKKTTVTIDPENLDVDEIVLRISDWPIGELHLSIGGYDLFPRRSSSIPDYLTVSTEVRKYSLDEEMFQGNMIRSERQRAAWRQMERMERLGKRSSTTVRDDEKRQGSSYQTNDNDRKHLRVSVSTGVQTLVHIGPSVSECKSDASQETICKQTSEIAEKSERFSRDHFNISRTEYKQHLPHTNNAEESKKKIRFSIVQEEDTVSLPETDIINAEETESIPDPGSTYGEETKSIPDTESTYEEETKSIHDTETINGEETKSIPDTETINGEETKSIPDTETINGEETKSIPDTETINGEETKDSEDTKNITDDTSFRSGYESNISDTGTPQAEGTGTPNTSLGELSVNDSKTDLENKGRKVQLNLPQKEDGQYIPQQPSTSSRRKRANQSVLFPDKNRPIYQTSESEDRAVSSATNLESYEKIPQDRVERTISSSHSREKLEREGQLSLESPPNIPEAPIAGPSTRPDSRSAFGSTTGREILHDPHSTLLEVQQELARPFARDRQSFRRGSLQANPEDILNRSPPRTPPKSGK